MSSAEVIVRPACSYEDCDSVAELCGASFPEECHGQGLSVQQWASIEADDLKKVPSWWRQIGLACEGSKVLGVVVLTLENEADDSITWTEYSRRVGCGPTILSMMYDQVLEEPLLEHECLIDFIAVSPDARGKGVGGKLMQWAEQTGAAILAETETAAVAARGVDMTLWVAADNSVACRLYQRSGYAVIRRTDSGACHCMASRVFEWFLGHPVWIKMRKQLPAPEHLATSKPQQMSISLSVTAGVDATMAATEAPFVNVPLELEQLPGSPKAHGKRQRQQHPSAAAAATPAAEAGPAVPSSPGGRLFRKLSQGLFLSQASAATSGAAGDTPRSSVAPAGGAGGSGSQNHTPRIGAAPGSSSFSQQQQQHQRQEATGRHSWNGGYHKASSAREGQFMQLHAAVGGSSSDQPLELPQQHHQQSTLLSAAKLAVLNAAVPSPATLPPSVASASVISMPEDSDASEPGSPTMGVCRAGSQQQQHRATAAAASSDDADVFELIQLSTCSMSSGAVVAPA